MDWIGSLADSMTQYISQAERLYREIATPKTPPPKPAHVATDAKPITLTRNDVIAIATHARTASAEELQYILDHAKELSVTTEERAAISLDLSLIMAHRTRRLNGLRDDPSAKFIAQVLRLAETPYGLVSREWVNEQLADGSSAIQRCKLHRPPSCECWSASRAILYQAERERTEVSRGLGSSADLFVPGRVRAGQQGGTRAESCCHNCLRGRPLFRHPNPLAVANPPQRASSENTVRENRRLPVLLSPSQPSPSITSNTASTRLQHVLVPSRKASRSHQHHRQAALRTKTRAITPHRERNMGHVDKEPTGLLDVGEDRCTSICSCSINHINKDKRT